MTIDQIFEILNKYNIGAQQLYNWVECNEPIMVEREIDENDDTEYEEDEYKINLEEIVGEVILEEEEGGYEGAGETWTVVFYFKNHNIYLRVDGYFDSWGGADLDSGDGLYHVVPVQRMTTYYEKPENLTNTEN